MSSAWLPRTDAVTIRRMPRRWITVTLLLLGIPISLLATAGIGFGFGTAIATLTTPSKQALFTSNLSVWGMAVVYVNLYIVWTWLVLRRKQRKQAAGFDVLPRKP